VAAVAACPVAPGSGFRSPPPRAGRAPPPRGGGAPPPPRGRRVFARARAAHLRVGDLPAASGALLGSPRRCLPPQLLEPVELARLGREDVHHHVEVIHEDPVGPTGALDAARQRAVLAL